MDGVQIESHLFIKTDSVMGVISEIEVQKKKKERFNLFLDGQFYAGISADTLVKHGLYKGKEISLEQLNQLVFDEAEQKVFDRAANLLLKTLKTEKEIRQKLKDWLYKSENKELVDNPELIIENVIHRLIDIKLIDDVRFAEAFVNDRNEFHPRSERMIEYELSAKGVEKEVIKKVIGGSGMDDKRTAEEVLFKKFRSKFIEKGNQKKIAFLQSKGFDWDTISDLIIEVD